MKLSILILTLPSRFDNLYDLLNTLLPQAFNNQVQVLWLGDNKSMTVGEKRNKLLSIADGDYVVFVDDDDHLSEDYISEILKAIETGTECITIGGWYTKDKDPLSRAEFNFNSNVGHNHNMRDQKTRKFTHNRLPNHICVWKREIAQRVKFPNKSLGEDHIWGEQQSVLGYTEYKIEKDLYHYDFNKSKTETRK